MIIGHISQNLDEIIFSENLKLAFDFLKSFKVSELRADKIININGDEVYAMYSENSFGREVLLESHLKYVDIHYVIEGNDRFAYAPLGYDGIIEKSRNIESDIITYNGKYPLDFNLKKKFFVILYPQDIHSACIESVNNKKIVIKVAINNQKF